jgi:hypothetical protein
MNERNARYFKWMQQCFFLNIIEADRIKLEASSPLKMRFFNAYENIEMEIVFNSK